MTNFIYNNEVIGSLISFGDALIFTAGDSMENLKKMFLNDNAALIAAIHAVNDYRKKLGYKYLYIDRHNTGIANLRNTPFWEQIGFKQDAHPALLYLDN